MGESTAADRERARRWHAANRERANERRRLHHLANRERANERDRRYAKSHREEAAERARRYRAGAVYKENSRQSRETLRGAVFDHYGWSCACCGSTKPLCIDHVNGDGREHREQLFGKGRSGSARKFYRWLIANDFPDGFQTLCMRCNSSKSDQPRCRLNHRE